MDIDDLLADVESMISYEKPTIPPRTLPPPAPTTHQPYSTNSLPPSMNSSSSSSSVFDSQLAPPSLPHRSTSPRSYTPPATLSTPPRSPARNMASLSTPPRSPPVPPREEGTIPRAYSEGAQFKKSAFQNFEVPNPHEDSLRRKNSIDDLNKRAQQLSLQRNQVTFRHILN